MLCAVGMTVAWIIDTAKETDDANKVETWTVILAMHCPFCCTTGKDLLKSEGLDKMKVAVGFVQMLAASKITFRLDLPFNFRWLIDLLKTMLSFDFTTRPSVPPNFCSMRS